MFFSYDDFGHTLTLFSLQHLVSVLIFAVLPCVLLVLFRKRLRASKAEPAIRIGIGIFGMLFEFGLYAWHILNGQTDWRNIIPTTLCGLSIYVGSYVMITMSKRVSPVVYYFCFGAFFSFLIADTSFGFDRFRYYTYFVIHGLILFEALYLILIKGIRADKRAFKKACIVLLPILAASIVLSRIFDVNFFYLYYPPFEDFPVYQWLFDTNRYLYSAAAAVSYYILMSVMYGIAKWTGIDKPQKISGIAE